MSDHVTTTGEASSPEDAAGGTRRRRILRQVLLPVLVLAGASAIFGILMATRTVIQPEPPVERVWAVGAASIKQETTRPRIPLFGQVVAGRSIEMRPLVAGRISAVGPGFREGGLVAEGDLLIAIDPFDYETAKALRSAELAEARAGLREVEADLAAVLDQFREDREQITLLEIEVDRRQQLHDRGTISRKNLDDALLSLSRQQQATSQSRNAVERSRARVERQQATIRRAEIALVRAERDLDETRLTAPFGGWLVDVSVEVGKQVNTGERVARLVDAARLEIRVTIPNRLFGELEAQGGAVGRHLDTVWRMGDTVRRFPARIQRLEGRIDATSGGVAAFATLGNLPAGTNLRPGAFVEVVLQGPELHNVIRLPVSAVHDDAHAFRIGSDDRLEAVPVTVRAREKGTLLVQGPLEDGQRVVLTRFPEIAPGIRVIVP